jgi:hypothetical protein
MCASQWDATEPRTLPLRLLGLVAPPSNDNLCSSNLVARDSLRASSSSRLLATGALGQLSATPACGASSSGALLTRLETRTKEF